MYKRTVNFNILIVFFDNDMAIQYNIITISLLYICKYLSFYKHYEEKKASISVETF